MKNIEITSYLSGAFVMLSIVVFMLLTGCGDVTVNAEQPADKKTKEKPQETSTETESEEEKPSETATEKEEEKDEYVKVDGVDGYKFVRWSNAWYWISPEPTEEYTCPQGFTEVSFEDVSANGRTYAHNARSVFGGSKYLVYRVVPDGLGDDTYIITLVSGPLHFKAYYIDELPADWHSVCQEILKI